MDYESYLSSIDQNTNCPFCKRDENLLLWESENFYVTLAKAPYVKDHLLIIPKKHVVFLHELTKEEQNELRSEVQKRNIALQKIHEGTTIILRDSQVNASSGKSISHLHVHIVPDCWIGALTGANDNTRKCYSTQEMEEQIIDLKQRLQ